MTINYFKAVIALVALILITVLMAIKTIDATAGMSIFTFIVGYATGNGIGAIQGNNRNLIEKATKDG